MRFSCTNTKMMLTEHNVWDDVTHNAMHSTSISTSIHQDISSNWLKTQRWRVTGCLNKNRGQFFGSEQEVKKKQMDLFMLTESISALFTRFIAKNNSWSKIKNIYISYSILHFAVLFYRSHLLDAFVAPPVQRTQWTCTWTFWQAFSSAAAEKSVSLLFQI